MIPPVSDSTPWGLIEWLVSALSASIVGIVGYILRNRSRLNDHELRLDNHKEEIEQLKKETRDTRDTLTKHPTREDIREDLLRIQSMMETRFDRLDSRVDSILNRKP